MFVVPDIWIVVILGIIFSFITKETQYLKKGKTEKDVGMIKPSTSNIPWRSLSSENVPLNPKAMLGIMLILNYTIIWVYMSLLKRDKYFMYGKSS